MALIRGARVDGRAGGLLRVKDTPPGLVSMRDLPIITNW